MNPTKIITRLQHFRVWSKNFNYTIFDINEKIREVETHHRRLTSYKSHLIDRKKDMMKV